MSNNSSSSGRPSIWVTALSAGVCILLIVLCSINIFYLNRLISLNPSKINLETVKNARTFNVFVLVAGIILLIIVGFWTFAGTKKIKETITKPVISSGDSVITSTSTSSSP